ncbi:hypothetical protein VE26_00045, partial [Devosia chinhatensis]
MQLLVLDDGRLTDGKSRTVDFRNTVIILTTNLGAEYLVELRDGESVELVRGKVLDMVKASFRPEFLNRIDEILLLHRLGREHMGSIVDSQFARLANLPKDRVIVLNLDPWARKWIANEGYASPYGLRSHKRVRQRAASEQLSYEIPSGRVVD